MLSGLVAYTDLVPLLMENFRLPSLGYIARVGGHEKLFCYP